MGKFIIKRVLYGFLVLFGVLTVVFFLFNVLPGDPIRMRMGQHTDQKSIDVIKADLGLDQPLGIQYLMFLNDLSFVSFHNVNRLDSTEHMKNASAPIDTNRYYLDPKKYGEPTQLLSLGNGNVMVWKAPYLRRSYINQRPVWDLVSSTLPETVVLAITSIIFAAIIGILFGILTAIYKNTWLDKIVSVFSTLGMAVPSFFSALIIAWLFGYLWRDYTGLKNIGSLHTTDVYTGEEYLDLKNLILPAITLGIRPLALIIQLTRSSMLEILTADFVRTARAKGLHGYVVITKHALKNALNPVITAISGWFAGLMAGAAFVEAVFDWKGIGGAVVDALMNYDLPVVMGSTLVFATCFVIINIAVDVIYGILDPRVRLA
jgi:peptide/nickel transport system permease protein